MTISDEPGQIRFSHGLLVPARRGRLHLWHEPEEYHCYTIGGDTAEGIRGGDFSVFEVVDNETCAQVAEWHGHMDPIEFGELGGVLARYFNDATIAFETGASAHGLSAAHACLSSGYGRMYMRQVWESVDRKMTEKLGWATTVKTKPLMVDRVRTAISSGHEINSQVLLRELLAMKYDVKDQHENPDRPAKLRSREHDDCFAAYSIALLARDNLLQRGLAPPVEEPPEKWVDKHWREWEASTGGEVPAPERCWDGI